MNLDRNFWTVEFVFFDVSLEGHVLYANYGWCLNNSYLIMALIQWSIVLQTSLPQSKTKFSQNV